MNISPPSPKLAALFVRLKGNVRERPYHVEGKSDGKTEKKLKDKARDNGWDV